LKIKIEKEAGNRRENGTFHGFEPNLTAYLRIALHALLYYNSSSPKKQEENEKFGGNSCILRSVKSGGIIESGKSREKIPLFRYFFHSQSR